MAILRFKALEMVANRETDRVFPPSEKISDYFAESCFNLDKMKAILSPQAFKRVTYAIRKGKKIDENTANAVAAAAKNWAI